MFSLHLMKRWYNFATIYKSAADAVKDIPNGAFLLVGGFGICGVPMNLINAIKEAQIKDLTCASNNCGLGDKEGKTDWGLGVLLKTHQIKKMIASYIGQNVEFQRQYWCGQIQLEICPQGTLAEKIRSGGAGIPAFYTATGVDTIIEKGGFPIKFSKSQNLDDVKKGKVKPKVLISSQPKQTANFNGKKYILEPSIFGDYALVKAKRADKLGNLQFEMTERNFNADMATAAKCVIAEVEQIVENGQIDPENVHVPAVYVDRIFKLDPNSPFSDVKSQKLTIKGETEVKSFVSERDLVEKKITYDKSKQIKNKNSDPVRLKIARRAAKQVKNGMNVNLGIGIPTLLPTVLPQDVHINLESENGIMGVGPYPTLDNVSGKNINAGKETITLNPGGSYFSSSQSFAIIRGGHLDMTMLGAMEVSEDCDIANWIIPGKMMKGMGGAMDLVSCGSKVVVLMEHSAKSKDGKLSLKLLPKCKLPLTAKGVVSKVITELAVFENLNGKLVLTEIAEETTLEEVQNQTGFPLTVVDNLLRF